MVSMPLLSKDYFVSPVLWSKYKRIRDDQGFKNDKAGLEDESDWGHQ